MDYSSYGANAFAQDYSFQQWILKKAQPEEQAFWETYYATHPQQQAAMTQARNWILSLHEAYEDVAEEEVDEEMNRLVETARQRTPRRLINWPRIVSRVAAVLVLGLGVAGWLFYQSGREETASLVSQRFEEVPFWEKENTGSRPLLLSLDDGSTVLLQSQSRIRVPKSFDPARREVILEGEAFFEVAKNPKQPFFVYAQGLVAKVLGTSFNIIARNRNVTIIVKTGRVALFPDKEKEAAQASTELTGLVLTPNQQLTYQSDQLKFTNVQTPEYLPLPIQKLNFDFKRTPLSQVFATLEKAYGVTIRYDKETLGNCQLTALLGDEPLSEKMNLICRTVEASYTLTDSLITVKGQGCR
ncbi:FecR family protein [Siphonobacter curvatus]|uniref:Iron dicitrate transport regulator FecR n=1 Tax=Siphonobacter curvatus TaxID=2094562 RepID=A0A2S7IFZ7_9BACT|nr:FecR family protein [Siphonobacter curvatus]PQA54023.1 iron dicitrate transport regulator FecR [Siphonobacter curvatus]